MKCGKGVIWTLHFVHIACTRIRLQWDAVLHQYRQTFVHFPLIRLSLNLDPFLLGRVKLWFFSMRKKNRDNWIRDDPRLNIMSHFSIESIFVMISPIFFIKRVNLNANTYAIPNNSQLSVVRSRSVPFPFRFFPLSKQKTKSRTCVDLQNFH